MVKGLKIALQLYTIREYAENDFRGALQKAKDMGYAGVEFAGLGDQKPADVKEMLLSIGLEPVSAHVPITELAKDPAGIISIYKEIGCPYIAIPWLDESSRPGNDDWDKTKADIASIAKECEKQGIILLYHNHDFEFVKDKDTGEYALDQLYREIPELETEIDVCWVKIAGEDPAAYIRKYKGRAPVVHLKDFVLQGEKPTQMYELIGVEDSGKEDDGSFEFRPVGHGVQDIPTIIDAAVYAGAAWVVVEQDSPSPGKSELECAEMGIEYLKSL